MDVNIAGVAVLNKAAAEQIRALVEADIGLWMDTEMQAFEVINPVAHPVYHGGEKPAQGIRGVIDKKITSRECALLLFQAF